MTAPRIRRCAIYTRKSSEEGLDQTFNSLDAQREACEAYIKSQAHEGWRPIDRQYDDGGYSGGSMDRPAVKRLMADLESDLIDVIVVYKVDRLTRSLTDFARIVEVLDRKGISFVSVTQHFNTTSSMGRLTLNVLLSFAQFEREVTGERIRDKVAASKKKGMWMGGFPPLGYDILNRKLAVNEPEAETVRHIFGRYLVLGSVRKLTTDLKQTNVTSKRWKTIKGPIRGGNTFTRGALYHVLRNRIYLGEICHKGSIYAGEHRAIVPMDLWRRTQDMLDGNLGQRSAALRQPAEALLTGILFDDAGNRMTPSHVKKRNGQRYRYYVSQAVLQNRPDQTGSVKRIAARQIEDLVRNIVERVLPSDIRMQQDADAKKPRHSLDQIQRIEIGSDYLSLALNKAVKRSDRHLIAHRIGDGAKLTEREGCLTVTIPIKLARRGGETSIEGPNGGPATETQRVDATLIDAIAKAQTWCAQLSSGDVKSMKDLARIERCNESHIRHRINLAFLAPDIVEMILNGRQPPHLMLERLVRLDLALDWRKQRQMLGLRAA